MYISSFLLFCSSLAVLYIGVKNCKHPIYMHDINIEHHPQKDNIFFGTDFLEHSMFQKGINHEIENRL